MSEAQRLVRQWAGSRLPEDNAKRLIERAARRLDWSYRRTKAIYYREARVVTAEEMDALRKREKAAVNGLDLAALARRLERIERRLNL